MPNPNWLDEEIRRGLSKLLCLRLDGTPAGDLIEGTAQAWLDAVTYRREWLEVRDAPRVAEGFRALVANSRSWPTPHDLIASLPSPEAQPQIAHESRIPKTRSGRIQHLSELLGDDLSLRAVEQGRAES